jgi:two-component system response regulator MprA
LTLDPRTREVQRGGRPINLTPIEFALLQLFLSYPRHVLTRSFIFTRVWGFDFGAMSNSLNVYVGYLRRKTETEGAAADPHGARRRLRAARVVAAEFLRNSSAPLRELFGTS